MKNKNILITINNLNDIDNLKKLGNIIPVYPLKDYCVGIPNTFLITEINISGFILINRILDNKAIDKLKDILNNLNSNIKGIIFDDLGVLELIKDLKIEKILYLSHFNTNKESIKLYLNYVDSVVVSTDITYEQIKDITTSIPNKLTLFILGYQKAMYSRRLLINNYNEYYKKDNKENPILIKNDNNEFLVYENTFGTIFYHYPVFLGLELLDLPSKYYFINSAFLTSKDIEDLINKKNTNYTKGFLYTKTTYKLKGDNND